MVVCRTRWAIVAAVLGFALAWATPGARAEEAQAINANTPWRVYLVTGDAVQRVLGKLQYSPRRDKTVVFDPAKVDPATFRTSPLPPAEWTSADFNDVCWPRYQTDLPDFLGDYGTDVPTGPSLWPARICMRTCFGIADPAKVTDLKLTVEYLGGAVVYVNGQEVGRGNMPDGEIRPFTCANDYPLEAYVSDDGVTPLPALNATTTPDKALQPRYQQRIRTVTINVPSRVLVKGRNVLAIALHRAAIAGPFARSAWSHVGFREALLTSASGAGVVAYADAVKGTHLWSASTVDEVCETPAPKSLVKRSWFWAMYWGRGMPVKGVQRDYARQLLTHRNPYTGLTYAEDPAVAFVEIINENGLLNSWHDGRFDVMPAPFVEELQRQWNVWLAGRYADTATLRAAWADETAVLGAVPTCTKAQAAKLPPARARDFRLFLYETEDAYYKEMRRFLRDNLGVRALIVGTIAQNSTPHIMGQLDAIDVHEYWNHPKYQGVGNKEWYITEASMANSNGPLRKFGFMSLFRQAGKPFTVTEFNHCSPSPYAGEGPLFLAAYAALQDWDALYLFSWSNTKTGDLRSFFMVGTNPAVMANSVVAASLFRRADVAVATQVVEVGMTREQEREIIATRGSAWSLASAGNRGVPMETALLHRVRMRVNDDPATAALPPPERNPKTERYVSDTGELVYDTSRPDLGIFTVNAPRVKSVVGYPDGRAFPLGTVTITPGATLLHWCTVSLTLLDGDSFADPKRALLVATGKTDNTDMEWTTYGDNPRQQTIKTWGTSPVRTEVYPTTVVFPAAGKRVTVHALDVKGQRGEVVDVKIDPRGNAVVTIGPPHATLWYEIAWED